MPIVPLDGFGIMGHSYEPASQHKDVEKASEPGDKMHVTVEFTPAGKDQEVWEVIRTILLKQYLEQNKIGFMQSEFEVLHSIPLKGGSLRKGGNE